MTRVLIIGSEMIETKELILIQRVLIQRVEVEGLPATEMVRRFRLELQAVGTVLSKGQLLSSQKL